MKILHLIRHAKSSWKEPGLADIDRPLNKRGKRSCRIMAGEIYDAGCRFEHVFCSPAVRAQHTIRGLSDHLKAAGIEWTTDAGLYTFYAGDLLEWCRGLDNRLSEVVIVGHNPALTDLVSTLGDRYLDNLPTCAWARLEGDLTSWMALATGTMVLTDFLKPKIFI
ncbi:MAG TPA: phosphoglycerate mutase [Desulfobacteraceae bacterium]|nr:phosphoglycerate mutase [Desulfobacteraceae bacterium]